jgi:tRNA dimethylallyltransferase
MNRRVNPDLFLAGPTGVGKSAVALILAEKLKAEIVSVDSMQVYRGMDIGTAKPSPEERARVRHHLVDVAEPSEPFDAAQFVRLARAAAEDIQLRGSWPLFCGGTGLYFRALLEGLGETPPPNPQLRAQIQATPLPKLLEELAERDPVTYARIDRQNPRRVIRALEVLRITGKPFSALRAEWGATEVPWPFFALERTAEDLHQRIGTRVNGMFHCGLVPETRKLLELDLGKNRTALQSLGYHQVVEYLEGKLTLEQAMDLVKLRTRQYAKRQMTWFRRQPGVQWLFVPESEEPEVTAERIMIKVA